MNVRMKKACEDVYMMSSCQSRLPKFGVVTHTPHMIQNQMSPRIIFFEFGYAILIYMAQAIMPEIGWVQIIGFELFSIYVIDRCIKI